MVKGMSRRRRLVLVGAFAARPRLLIALGAGLAAGLLLKFAAGLSIADSAVLGWDALCVTFAGLTLRRMLRRTVTQMREHAAQDDQGRAVILFLVVLTAAVSLGGAAAQLMAAKQAHDAHDTLGEALHAGLAFVTVAASWFFVQLNFALHYAHVFYDRQLEGTGDVGGLKFPGGGPPDYWDFLHFSVIIGVAAQTADIAITSKALRRLNTAHAAFAFTFNAMVVALTINLLAGLFQ